MTEKTAVPCQLKRLLSEAIVFGLRYADPAHDSYDLAVAYLMEHGVTLSSAGQEG